MTSYFPVRDIHRYAKFGEIPDFVKSAEELSSEEVSDLLSSAFADSSRRLPTHTKAATWLSALRYFNGVEDDWDQHARANLIKSAAFWEIEPSVWKISETVKMANSIPVLNDTDYAIVVKTDGDEVIERRFPLLDGTRVKAAAAALWNERDKYPWGVRKQAAKRILNRATNFGVILDNKDYLEKAAGYGIARVGELRRGLLSRRYMMKTSEARDRVKAWEVKFQDSTESDEQLISGDTLEKLAEFIDEVDRREKLYRAYTRGIRTPEELCYTRSLNVLEKAAGVSKLRDGTPFDFQSLNGVPAAQFAALGDDFVEAIAGGDGNVDLEKASAVVPTLPMDDTSVFVRSLSL